MSEDIMESCECEGIHLGDRVLDNITEFEGIVVGLYLGIGGEEQMEVQPEGCDENGIPLQPQWFSSVRLYKIEDTYTPDPKQLDS